MTDITEGGLRQSGGLPGTTKVGIGDMSKLEAQTVVGNVAEREEAEAFADELALAAAAHGERSPRAQTVDEQKSARLTRDYDTWASDPARFDFPGVDSRKESFGTTVDTDLFGDLAPEKWG